MAYASASDVAALTQNILSGEEGFLTATCPTLVEVKQWLSSGCGIIETKLAGNGYSVPVASTVQAFDWMRNLNSLYGAAFVEFSRTNITLTLGERTRGQVFYEMFWKELEKFISMDLTLIGVTRTSDGKLYVGGISQADKDTRDQDTDRVKPRFRRGEFDFPGTIRPSETSAS